jgi:5-amino-6-(5-phospho-D-ribitylamino)uracil phosphatase
MPELVLCFDFDGTLVDGGGRIHPRDVEILGGETPVTLVPATGRPLHAVRHVLSWHGLFADRPVPFPLVLENGAAVYEAGERLRARHPFALDVQGAFIEAMLASPRVTFLLFSLDEVRILWPSEAGWKMVRRFALSTRPFSLEEEDADAPLTKVVSIAETAGPLRAFAAETADLALERAYSLPTVLEFTRVGVDKGRGLADLLGERPGGTRLVVAGDGENDLPLFELADLSFAPEDSPAAIKARADQVVDVSENGLLAPILRIVG